MSITLDETMMQADAWKEATDKALAQSKNWLPLLDSANYILFTGCGSTYYLSLAASSLCQTLTHRSTRVESGQEKSVVQTRSFSSMYITTAAMVATAAEKRDLTDVLHELPSLRRRYIPWPVRVMGNSTPAQLHVTRYERSV